MAVLPFYGIKDTVSNDFLDTHAFLNDGLACRTWLPVYSRQYPVKDLVLYHLYDFDTSTGRVVGDFVNRVVSWDSYKFPESKVKASADSSTAPTLSVTPEMREYMEKVIQETIVRSSNK